MFLMWVGVGVSMVCCWSSVPGRGMFSVGVSLMGDNAC